MKKSTGKRYTESDIIKILKELDAGESVSSLSQKYGVSEGSIHRWKSKYGGMDHSELQKIKELEK